MFKQLSQDKEDNTTTFLTYGIKTQVINSLRRVMLSEYKNSAFHPDNIDIIFNDTVTHNEILKHRLALIPIECHSNEPIKVTLDIKNENKEIQEIYSDELQIISGQGKIYPEILLFKLKKGNCLTLTATSDVRTSQSGGVYYRPVTCVFFRFMKSIYIKENIQSNKLLKYFLEMEWNIYNNYEFLCSKKDGYICIGISDNIRDIEVTKLTNKLGMKEDDIIIENMSYKNDNVYSFTIESIFIEPEKVLKRSIEILQDKFRTFLKNKCEVDENENQIIFYIENIDSTILNPLSEFLREDSEINFAHYNKDHPYDNFTKLHITLKNKNANYINIIKNTVNKINSYLSSVLLE